MTLKVTIQPAGFVNGGYPVYFAMEGGVKIGASGELILVAACTGGVDNLSTEFRIYAPGTWIEVNAEPVSD